MAKKKNDNEKFIERLTIVLKPETKKAFFDVCNANSENPSEELRKFIEKKIEPAGL